MEFLVMPQFTSSLIECFSGGGGACTYRDCRYTECTGIYIECEDRSCTIENQARNIFQKNKARLT